jgi:serine/threonine protein phosphatase PrpC
LPLTLKVIGKTDKGLVRPGNEDYLHLDDENKVYAVCDGMGGHQAGEVASMTASQTIQSAFNDFATGLLNDPSLNLGRSVPATGELLIKAIRLANRSIFRRSLTDRALSGMGTTIVAMAFEADIVSVAHVGDSRAYRIGKRALEPLTKDHSWLSEVQSSQNLSKEEATTFVGKNIITRALGVRETIAVDYRVVKVNQGDIFLLCSDGLCGYADDDEIFDVISRTHGDISRITDNLIQMANDRGGADNVTVIAIEVLEVVPSPLPEVDVFTQDSESLEVLEGEDRWLEKIQVRDENLSDAEAELASRSPTNKLHVFGIFFLFVIIAVVIIYFAAFR